MWDGISALGGPQPQGHSTGEHESLSESNPNSGLELSKPLQFGVQGVADIRTKEIKQKTSLWVRLLLIKCSRIGVPSARVRAGAVGAHMVTSSLRWYATGKRRIDVFPTAMSTVFLRRQKTFSFT